jgi:hypothetical protein
MKQVEDVEIENLKKRFLCAGCGHSLEILNADTGHVTVDAHAITMPDQTVSLLCARCLQRTQDLPPSARCLLFEDAEKIGSPHAYMVNRYLLAETSLEGSWWHTLPRPPGLGGNTDG